MAHERSGRSTCASCSASHGRLLAIVHETRPPAYFFIGEASADLAFDPARLPAGWTDHVKWAHFGCISLVREPLAGTLAALAADLHARGVKISFDPNVRNLMTAAFQPTLEKMAALADLIKVSDEDLRHLFGGDGPDAIAAVRAEPARGRARHARGGDALRGRRRMKRRRASRWPTPSARGRVDRRHAVQPDGRAERTASTSCSRWRRAPRPAGIRARIAPTLDEVVALIER